MSESAHNSYEAGEMLHAECTTNLGVELPQGQGKKWYRKAAHSIPFVRVFHCIDEGTIDRNLLYSHIEQYLPGSLILGRKNTQTKAALRCSPPVGKIIGLLRISCMERGVIYGLLYSINLAGYLRGR